MKCLTNVILAILIGSASMTAGVLSPMFNEFSHDKNCTVIKIPRLVMWLAKKSSDEPIMKKITSMKVMVIEGKDTSVNTRITSRVKELAPDLNQLIRVNDDGEHVTIWMDSNKDKINSIYVYVNDNSEAVMVEFNGKFTVDDITDLVDKANDNKH